MASATADQPSLYGQPTGLYMLFFAEMWERFSYYGMRALLVLYITKGFLGLNDGDAYKIYGAYAAMVYMTPFFGGLIADRLLGQRKAVILGGLLMAAGHLLMTWESEIPFYCALALLIVGNGFFKPNISTIVGGMYADGDPRRDSGFTIFYMGINLGAALAPLLCGYVGETMGWHYGFGLATGGMLVGLAVFVVPTLVAQVLIGSSALVTAGATVYFNEGPEMMAVRIFVAIALIVSAGSAVTALNRANLPPEAGGAPDPEALEQRVMGIPMEYAVYLGALLFVPAFAILVWSNRHYPLIGEDVIEPLMAQGAFGSIAGTFLSELSTPAGLLLIVIGSASYLYIIRESLRMDIVGRQRLWMALCMMGFSALFWAFFEQGGSSINTFTDRNVDRVSEERVVASSEVGTSLTFRVAPITADPSLRELPVLDQEQFGYPGQAGAFTMTQLTELRESGTTETVTWTLTEEHVGMGVGGNAIPASPFQSANPIYILLFGPVFSWLWSFLGRRNLEPSTPVKFAFGLFQLGLGFVVLWYGTQVCDDRGMVAVSFLLLGYLLHTTGELCLSPVGLSMVTKLSPKRLVATVMGAWFLATAFSGLLAAVIAGFTGTSHGGSEGEGIPVPIETVHVYGEVFGAVGLAAIIASVCALVISPILRRWMHEGEPASV